MTQPTSSCGSFSSLVWHWVGGRRQWCWADLKPLALVAVLLVPINVCSAAGGDGDTPEDLEQAKRETLALAASGGSEIASTWWPWKTTDELEKPPSVQTYQLPTMTGDDLDFHIPPAALHPAPALDADGIFNAVLACYPEKSKYDIDVALRAAVRSQNVLDLEDTSSLGGSYVGIVANMPLYSGKELDKEKEREYVRRKDTAQEVADFIAAIAQRNQATREFALYRSLEARAAIRVKQGITEASEQVGYLEKVAQAEKELVQAEAKIMESRLLLAGMCDPKNAKTLGNWLKQVATVPKETP